VSTATRSIIRFSGAGRRLEQNSKTPSSSPVEIVSIALRWSSVSWNVRRLDQLVASATRWQFSSTVAQTVAGRVWVRLDR